MGQARRWAGVALFTLAATCLSGAVPGPALAEEEALGWKVNGAVDVGGMYKFGTNLGSPKLNNYRDMDNGFLGELELRGEKKDSPYFFELYAKNPARDDQMYEGAFGRYGTFRLDLEWDRTPVVLSNSGQTIYQLNGDRSNLPPAQWAGIVATYNAALTPLTLPLNPVVAGRVAAIQNTVNGLLRPVSLGYNTDVARAGFKYTPFEDLRFDLEYSNIRREGRRPIGSVIGSPGGSVNELAIPIENYTNEVKFGAEYARQDWGFHFNYTGSFFNNNYQGYSWDNPVANTNTATATASDRISAAPDNSANTFSLTGTASLPLRSRINGTFAYTMLRQNQTFNQNTLNPALTQRNFDDAGSSSADAEANLIMGNVVLTSRPLDSVTATARYRYFDYQNDTPAHTFSFMYPTGQGPAPQSDQTSKERYTKQNTGIDLGWRPVQMVSFKGGYEYEHWNRGNYEDQSFSNSENIGKFAMDVTPIDWFLGRVTYTYGDRTISGFNFDPTLALPQSIKYNYSPRTRNRVDALLQFSPWETLAPSISGGYASDDYSKNLYGLTSSDYWTAGVNLDWTPLKWLTISGDYSYERYNNKMANQYVSPVVANNWNSQSRDEFQNVGLSAVVDIIPKKFSITLGYNANFGYTTTKTSNPNFVAGAVSPPATNASATAYYWDKVFNVLQTFKIVAKYSVTEKLSLRGGFAYERYSEKDYARDPMQPFMGLYEVLFTQAGASTLNAAGIQSTYLGATSPGYETYILSAFVRYEF